MRICLWIFIFVCNMDGVNSSLHVVTHLQPLGYPNSYISCARSPGSRWEAQLILLYFCSGPTLYECASHSFETQPGGQPGLMIGSRVKKNCNVRVWSLSCLTRKDLKLKSIVLFCIVLFLLLPNKSSRAPFLAGIQQSTIPLP